MILEKAAKYGAKAAHHLNHHAGTQPLKALMASRRAVPSLGGSGKPVLLTMDDFLNRFKPARPVIITPDHFPRFSEDPQAFLDPVDRLR